MEIPVFKQGFRREMVQTRRQQSVSIAASPIGRIFRLV